MTRILGMSAVGALLLASCSVETESTVVVPQSDQSVAPGDLATDAPSAAAVGRGMAEASGGAPIKDGVAVLTPANTKIEWTGTHAGDKPDPRVGSLEKFSGTAEVDVEAKTLTSVSIEIDAASLKSFDEKLTNHLNSADFLDTREHPNATFKSTKIESKEGTTTITGDLTLHGTTKEVSFPATVSITDRELTMTSEFTIKRSEFGMDKMLDRVLDDVVIKIAVGSRVSASASGQSNGQGARTGGAGGRGNWDPDALFARLDANSDGKLTGDEINERMQERMTETDTDGNGEVSKEEFITRMKSFSGRRPGGEGNAAGGNTNP